MSWPDAIELGSVGTRQLRHGQERRTCRFPLAHLASALGATTDRVLRLVGRDDRDLGELAAASIIHVREMHGDLLCCFGGNSMASVDGCRLLHFPSMDVIYASC